MTVDIEELEGLIDSVVDAKRIMELTEEIAEKLNGERTMVVLPLVGLLSARVIFNSTDNRKDAIAALAIQFNKSLEIVSLMYDEAEEEAEESTVQ